MATHAEIKARLEAGAAEARAALVTGGPVAAADILEARQIEVAGQLLDDGTYDPETYAACVHAIRQMKAEFLGVWGDVGEPE